MEYENDFVDESLIEFEIDGKKFKYKPATADDELDWAEDYLEIIDGKPKQNFKKVTLCKLRNLKEVPYSKELINKIINIDRDWTHLKNEDRIKLLGRLNPTMFDKIIKKINGIDSPLDETKKN